MVWTIRDTKETLEYLLGATLCLFGQWVGRVQRPIHMCDVQCAWAVGWACAWCAWVKPLWWESSAEAPSGSRATWEISPGKLPGFYPTPPYTLYVETLLHYTLYMRSRVRFNWRGFSPYVAYSRGRLAGWQGAWELQARVQFADLHLFWNTHETVYICLLDGICHMYMHM